MDLTRLAEQRMAEAQRKGDFDNLPGAGKPLDLGQSMTMEQRLYQTVLKNSDVVPPEVELLKQRAQLKAAIKAAETDEERARLVTQLAGVQTELDLKLGTLKARKSRGARRFMSVKSGS